MTEDEVVTKNIPVTFRVDCIANLICEGDT